MADAIKTVYTYNLNGTQTEFNVPFEYLARKFVRVTLIGKDRKILVLNQDYRFATKTKIVTTQAWGQAQGYSYIEVRRYTSATERLIDYTDGSILRAYDLNISQLQTIHVAEEARDLTADTIGVNNDGELDARGRRIVNLVDATHDRDAVTFGQVKAMSNGAWNARNQAETFKNQAQGFRNEAEVSRNAAEAAKARAGASELKAKQWASNPNGQVVEGGLYSSMHYANASKSSADASARSQTAAAESQKHAANSQAAAATSQTGAAKEAQFAKEWASKPRNQVVGDGLYSARHYSEVAKEESAKLGNMNALAGTVDSVTGTSLKLKGPLSVNTFEVRSQGVELYGNTPFIDFHYGNDKGDYTHRLITTSDSFSFNRNIGVTGNVHATGRLHGDRGVEVGNDRYISGYQWGGAFVSQLNTNAAYFQQLPGNQDGSTYWPLIKQYGRRSTGYPTAFSMGMTSLSTNGFHTGNLVLSGDNNKQSVWTFNIDGTFTSGSIGCSGALNVNGTYTNTSQTGMILKNAGRRHIQYHTGSVIDGYFFKDPGAQPFYMNFGAAAQCEYKWESNGMFSCSKGWAIAADGNIKGSKWGGGWIDAWVNNHFKKKTKSWTTVMDGATSHGVSKALSQDVRFRQCWFLINGHWMPVSIGPDATYYVAGWGDGWIKFKISNNGRTFTNIQDNSTVPTRIVVENE